MSDLGVGILWLMDPQKSLEENVRMARERHLVRFGYEAEYVHVNAKDLPQLTMDVDGLPVKVEAGTLERHLFIGKPVQRKVKLIDREEGTM